jgi:hypothetical protein
MPVPKKMLAGRPMMASMLDWFSPSIALRSALVYASVPGSVAMSWSLLGTRMNRTLASTSYTPLSRPTSVTIAFIAWATPPWSWVYSPVVATASR